MKTFTAEFVKTECSFDADFGHIQTAGAGDYEKGYEIGYDIGFQKGYAEGETAGYNKGYTEGQSEEYSKFWDNFQQNGSRTDYTYAFAGVVWTDETLKPKYDIKPITAVQTFRQTQVTKIDALIDFSNCTNVSMCFYLAQNLIDVNFKANTIKKSIEFTHSSKLSATSIQSIINGLAIADTAKTITFHTGIVFTDEQKAEIQRKGWTLVQ